MPTRISFFVDGFNLYHSIRDALQRNLINQGKWLDLSALCKDRLGVCGGGAVLADILYFSAYARHVSDPNSQKRHDVLIQAMESTGVRPIMGKFKRKQIKCNHSGCGKSTWHFEEKETDVNIAVHLLEDLLNDKCDTAVIVSGDTDLCAAIRAAKRLCPQKKIACGFPYSRANNELKQLADFHFTLTPGDYQRFQLPPTVTGTGGFILQKPASW